MARKLSLGEYPGVYYMAFNYDPKEGVEEEEKAAGEEVAENAGEEKANEGEGAE